MDILLVARDSMFNNIIKYETRLPWGHASVIIDDVVYEFNINNNTKKSLSSVISDKSINRASIFYFEMLGGNKEAEELYKELFSTSQYDISSLNKIRNKCKKERDLENIQTNLNQYNCSNLIAKVCLDNYKQISKIPDMMKYIHWTQIIPNDYSKLELKKEFKYE